MSAVLDLAEVTKTSDVEIDGHKLWVRPGQLPEGRFWQLLSTMDVPLGMVIEHPTAAGSWFEALVPSSLGRSESTLEAVRRVVGHVQPAAQR